MKQREMKELLFQMLGDHLGETGFRLKKSEDCFLRNIVNGQQMLGVPFWNYQPEFEFSLNICIRLDAVEQVFHQFSGSPPRYHSMSLTTITRLEHFTETSGRYKVITVEDVTSIGRLLSKVIRTKIIPFYRQHEDVKSLDHIVNCMRPGVDVTQNPSGAMHSIILAWMAKNPELHNLIGRHREEMQLAPEADHAFNRLAEYIRTTQPIVVPT